MNSPVSVNSADDLLRQYAQGVRDFSDSTLNECTLSGAKLPQIILKRASLKVVDLSSANLSGSNLQQATLNVSRLTSANFSQAQMQQAQLNVTNLIQAVLVGANLSRASLIRAELLRADLSNATLTQANCQEADLREAQLRWARINQANLSQCDLRQSNLLGANLTSSQLYSAVLEAANLRGAVLLRAEMRHANLRGADLRGANLRGANLRWAELSGANLQEADLTEAKLSGANLIGTRLQGAILTNTTLVHTDLSRAHLQQAYLVGADLSGSTLTGALLHSTIRQDLKTTETLCQWVDLSPQGDRSEIRQMKDAEDIHHFFNRHPPKVQVLLDAPLTAAAHVVLATAYDYLGHTTALIQRSPNIHVAPRRTTLTFWVNGASELPVIAYLATWPFRDHPAVRNTLEILSTALGRTSEGESFQKIHQPLNRTIQQLASPHQHPRVEVQQLRARISDLPFFAAPLQVKLANEIGQTLELYQSSHFGIRYLLTEHNPAPTDSGPGNSPPPDAYRAFLSSAAS